MSDKIITLQLGGQARALNFGVMGFLKHLGIIVKADPLDLFSEGFSTDPEKAYKVNLAVIHAGLLADCDVRSVTADFTSEQVDKWVSCLETTEVEGLVLRAFAAMTGKTLDELKKVIAQAASQNGSIEKLVEG